VHCCRTLTALARAGVWVVDPVFMLDAIRETLDNASDEPAIAEPSPAPGSTRCARSSATSWRATTAT
jgi:hypothetical protein